MKLLKKLGIGITFLSCTFIIGGCNSNSEKVNKASFDGSYNHSYSNEILETIVIKDTEIKLISQSITNSFEDTFNDTGEIDAEGNFRTEQGAVGTVSTTKESLLIDWKNNKHDMFDTFSKDTSDQYGYNITNFEDRYDDYNN